MKITIEIPENIVGVIKADEAISRENLAQKAGISKSAARFYLKAYRDKLEYNEEDILDKTHVTADYNEDKAYIETTSFKVTTIEDAIKKAKLDTDKWEPYRNTVNHWDVTMKLRDEHGVEYPHTATNYQIKVWFRLIQKDIYEDTVLKLIERIPTFKAQTIPKFKDESDIACEIWPIDAHMGKLAWDMETGRGDYDLKISSKMYVDGVNRTLAFMSLFKPQIIYFGVGQDLMHVDNYAGVTPKGGNVLDTDSRLPKIFDTVFDTVLQSIYNAREVAPVEILWVPGNHDLYASRYLCHSLKQHFRNDKYVTVDVSPEQRKMRLWGNLMVGWTHEIVSRHNSWVNELAQRWPEAWGQSKFREWHHGHKHKKSEVKTWPVNTQGGVLLRQLTALSPIDAWHYEYLFTDAVPGTESFVWSKKHGVIDNHIEWTDIDSYREKD